MSREAWAFWRDVDPERWKVGVNFWRTGCEFYVGKRLYRVRWSYL